MEIRSMQRKYLQKFGIKVLENAMVCYSSGRLTNWPPKLQHKMTKTSEKFAAESIWINSVKINQ